MPHRLYGHVDAAEPYSAGRWLADARAALAGGGRDWSRADPRRRHRALLQAAHRGLAAVPSIPHDIRERLRARVAAEGAPALHADLACARSGVGGAPRSRRSHAHRARARSHGATGRSLAEWHREGNMPPILDPAARVKRFLAPSATSSAGASRRVSTPCWRPARSRKCARSRRAGSIRSAGDEGARRAVADPPSARARSAWRKPPSRRQADTRHYAKRQFTWFRNQLPDWRWVAAGRGRTRDTQRCRSAAEQARRRSRSRRAPAQRPGWRARGRCAAPAPDRRHRIRAIFGVRASAENSVGQIEGVELVLPQAECAQAPEPEIDIRGGHQLSALSDCATRARSRDRNGAEPVRAVRRPLSRRPRSVRWLGFERASPSLPTRRRREPLGLPLIVFRLELGFQLPPNSVALPLRHGRPLPVAELAQLFDRAARLLALEVSGGQDASHGPAVLGDRKLSPFSARASARRTWSWPRRRRPRFATAAGSRCDHPSAISG